MGFSSPFSGVTTSGTIDRMSMHGTKGKKRPLTWKPAKSLPGSFQRRNCGCFAVWMDIHRDELLADWELVKAGEVPFRVRPLE